MTDTISHLEELLKSVPPRLVDFSDADLAATPTGRWTKKEILGHLIDSAANNHQRFVRAQAAPRLVFPSYEQEFWVTTNAYATEPWPEMVNLWLVLNRHLVHVVKAMPGEVLDHEVVIGPYAPMTLRALVIDYVHHMEGHLSQLLGAA